MRKTQKVKKTPHSPILPPETLEIAGRREILLDGVLGIAAYSTENVCIRTKCGFVEVSGGALVLCWSGENRLLLRGCIENIAFRKPVSRRKGEEA